MTRIEAPTQRSRVPGGSRLGWLDALRGLAAVTVALHHATYHYVPGFRRWLLEYFDPGACGVLVFFLVSGYIVPASLERTGSVRRFWVGRLFRIYPLLLAGLVALVALALTGVAPLRDDLNGSFDPITAALAHLTMLQDLLGVPSGINVLWTLSYEMAFYLLVVAFFTVRLHRRSAPIALVLALTGLALAAVLPSEGLTQRLGAAPVTMATTVVLVAAVALACVPRTRVTGALLGGALAAALVLLNGRVDAWQGLVLLAAMFVGTAIHRAEKGQIRVRTAAWAAGGVLAAALAGGAWRIHAWGPDMTEWGVKRAWLTAVLVAAALFAGGMALRNRRMPRPLTWLGEVSFSVYLLHPVLLLVLDGVIGRPGTDRPEWLLAYLAVLLVLSHLSYRLIEQPMQNLGRRVARRVAPAPVGPAPQPRPPVRTPEPATAAARS